MANIFNSVSVKTPKRHKFKLNHQCKLTGEMGQLLPIFCEETLPGDRWRIGSQQLIRFAPLSAPIMADVDAYVHFFFVPNRLIWKDWETFITGSRNGKKLNEEEIPTPPFIKIQPGTNYVYEDGKKIIGNGSLADYLQFPTTKNENLTNFISLNELPFRAYQRIFFDWYRDENLSDFDDFNYIDDENYNNGDNSVVFTRSDIQGSELRAVKLMKLQRRAWKKDYFTSALPFAQKGDDVLIPGTGGSNNVVGSTGLSIVGTADNVFGQFTRKSTGTVIDTLKNIQTRNNTTSIEEEVEIGVVDKTSTVNGVWPTFKTQDLANNLFIQSNAKSLSNNISEGTIRELRRAMAAQRFLEREAVGGTRYIEQILSFFGVKSSDARLQRSEFLGGSKQPVVVSQVLQTSQTTTGDSGSPLGQPAGNAVSAGGKYIFDRTFEEHGFIIGLLSVIPRADYMDGYPKKYTRRDRFDYYWPQFAHIGEQPIKRSELKYNFGASFDEGTNDETFGYTPRYAEYRNINSHTHGDFRDSLKYWTLARDFGEVPLLNESFLECKPSTRIFAYEESDFNHLWIQVGFKIDALRPLPKYGESL